MQPDWIPTAEIIEHTHITKTLQELGLENYSQFHAWSVQNYQAYWQLIIHKLKIQFTRQYSQIIDLTHGVENPIWLPDAQLNIISSCFNAPPDAIAIIYQADKNKPLLKMTYRELDQLSNRVANSLKKYFNPGAALGICMPMTPECVAIYLGIIKAGYSVVSIADSFSAEEIATRLRITNAQGIFTQDYILRGPKQLPLYSRVKSANAPCTIVLPYLQVLNEELRSQDVSWDNFLIADDQYTAVICKPQDAINILFSSGTTGDPKAIPWNHTTAIKCAADAYFHQDIHPEDVLAWSTNIGWMMGPWLIFASLINQATMALYGNAPLDKDFGEFIQDAKVTMLGVVPSLVKTWRASGCMENLDWQAIKAFSSTGESSNCEDMRYLMHLAGNKPVIEYCGGTEIGGAYITGTLVQPAFAATFSTPALGLDFVLLNEQGELTNNGEVALIPPSIGLSTELLNKDHYQVYYADMPASADGKILRRHGDQIEQLPNGYYRALGRVDDTMNLGGIKISSAEIERALADISQLQETAAIAVNPPNGGPSQLIIFAVPKTTDENLDLAVLKTTLQAKINQQLNPLFKIHEVVLIPTLPRTASNKVMRRVLRENYSYLKQ